MQEISEKAKLFKVGNSFGLRVTKKDTDKMKIEPGDELEKVISPDGKSITFKKIERISPETQKLIDKVFKDDKDLIEALKDL